MSRCLKFKGHDVFPLQKAQEAIFIYYWGENPNSPQYQTACSRCFQFFLFAPPTPRFPEKPGRRIHTPEPTERERDASRGDLGLGGVKFRKGRDAFKTTTRWRPRSTGSLGGKERTHPAQPLPSRPRPRPEPAPSTPASPSASRMIGGALAQFLGRLGTARI